MLMRDFSKAGTLVDLEADHCARRRVFDKRQSNRSGRFSNELQAKALIFDGPFEAVIPIAHATISFRSARNEILQDRE
jgi:hypothetical protein